MKKIMFTIICMFFVTGCGTKVLECTTSITDEVGLYSERTEFTFNGNGKKVKKVVYHVTRTYDVNDNIDTEEAYNYETENCVEYAKKLGFSCKTEKDGNTLSRTQTIDISKLDRSTRDTMNQLVNQSYDDVKKEFVDEGYTCK